MRPSFVSCSTRCESREPMRPKTLILRSGTVIDPVSGEEGVRRDVAVCGETIVAVEDVLDADEIVDVSGMLVTAAAVDCAAHVAFPGVWGLRAAGLFPDAETLARRYAERGFGHVHESWATLFDWGTVQAEWDRIPGPDVSVGLMLPLYDLTNAMDAQDVTAAHNMLSSVCALLGPQGFYLPEPRVRFRHDVYKHREKAAKDLLPFLRAACEGLSGPIVLPAGSLHGEDRAALSCGMHLQRAMGFGNAEAAGLFSASTGFDLSGLSADLGLAWPEKSVALSWVPPADGTEGRLWDVGAFLMLKAEPLSNEDFRDHGETVQFLAQGIAEGWALSCRHANLALVEDWEGLIRAFLEVWTVREWFLATRFHAAKALGFLDRGHLVPGARANLAVYAEPADETNAEWAKALSRCRRLYVGGREVYNAHRGGLTPSSRIGRSRQTTMAAIDVEGLAALSDGMSLRPETLRRLAPRVERAIGHDSQDS